MCCREEVVNSLFKSLNRVLFCIGPGSAKELIKSINEKFVGSAGCNVLNHIFGQFMGSSKLFSFIPTPPASLTTTPSNPHMSCSYPFVLDFDKDEVMYFPFSKDPFTFQTLLRVFMLGLLKPRPSCIEVFSAVGRIIFSLMGICYTEETEAAGRFLWHVQ